MVRGLALFGEAFAAFKDQYVLIGGAASDLHHDQAGLAFRATKDLDVVLILESMSPEFSQALWRFVEKGGYDSWETEGGERAYYRFRDPKDEKYPAQLELFARKPDAIFVSEKQRFVPIKPDQGGSSLSAILLDNEYYEVIRAGRIEVSGVSIAKPGIIIVLKAKAYLNLVSDKNAGKAIQSGNISKHKNDVFRMFRLLPGDLRHDVTPHVRADLRSFLLQMRDTDVDLSLLGIQDISKNEVLNNIAQVFRITL